MLILLLACAVPSEDTGKPGTPPDLPVSDCGGPTYEWMPVDTMGEVLEVEEMTEWSLTAESIRGLVGLAGIRDTTRVTSGARAWRVRYRTQDRGIPAEATAILAVPDPAPAEPPSLLYLHPSTGFEDFCAPSGRDLTWAGVPIALAGMGYAVAAPDYLGQNGFGAEAAARHPYLLAEPTAVASLDALRALWRFDALGVTPSRATALLGASQGGAGVVWVERYAPAYLPEADLVGMVATVPPLDLVGMARGGATTLTVASLAPPLFLTSANGWHARGADLGEVLTLEGQARVEESMATDCPSAVLPEDVTSLDQVYTSEWQAAVADGSFADSDPWGCFLAESSVATAALGPGPTPAFVAFGAADDVSLGDVHMAALPSLCDGGAAIEAIACEGLGHTDTVKATFDLQLDWLAARVAETPLAGTTCGTIEVVSCE